MESAIIFLCIHVYLIIVARILMIGITRHFLLPIPYQIDILSFIQLVSYLVVIIIVVVIVLLLPRDGGTARTAIQVHTVNLMELV